MAIELVRSKPSPAGALFDLSAKATRSLEDCALLLGQLTDEVRTLTVLPLTAEGRELVTAALKMFGRFNIVRADLQFGLGEMRRIRGVVEGLSNHGR